MGESRQGCAIRLCSEHDPGRGGEVSGVVFQAFCCYRDFSCPGCWEVAVITNQQFELFSPDQKIRFMDSSLLGCLVHHRHSVERSSCPQHGPLPMTLGREARGCSVHSHPHASKPGSAPSSLLAHHISSAFANSPHPAVSCLRDHS